MNNSREIFKKKLADYRISEEERLMDFMSKKYNLPIIPLVNLKVFPDALQLVKESDAREGMFAVYAKNNKKLKVAINSIIDPKLKDTLEELKGKGFECELGFATKKTLNQIWQYYKDIVATSATKPGTLSITSDILEEELENIRSLGELKTLWEELNSKGKNSRISKNVEYMVGSAIAIKCSDIHIEATDDGGIIRYRLDGVLVEAGKLDKGGYKNLVTRLKLLSNMKITSKGAQDGSFIVRLSDRTVSIRASFIPKGNDGSFVLRILDPKTILHTLDVLGIHPRVLNIFEEEIKKPNGMILTTGPTGSGKTTTLYSFLNHIRSESVKIITLEDPIEYRLEGVIQTQVTSKYSFSQGLRAILRQDPDVILVGEMRDNEVTDTAIQASLTGHLVFSTLHTNDAIGALSRLEQFDVDPQLFTKSINMIIAQRLVRKICPHCSQKHNLTDEQKMKVEKMISEMPKSYQDESVKTLTNILTPGPMSKECDKCINGYKGRVGVYEVFRVTKEVQQAYSKKEGLSQVEDAVKKQDLPFVQDDALYKVLNGQTSIEEMNRITGTNI